MKQEQEALLVILILDNKTSNNKPICLNGAIFVLCKILLKVTASVAEVELGGLFMNAQEVVKFKTVIEELVHP